MPFKDDDKFEALSEEEKEEEEEEKEELDEMISRFFFWSWQSVILPKMFSTSKKHLRLRKALKTFDLTPNS